uniref:Uncharacterized protein n=1 Tax=Panagrolaimus sp. ES5 TaxID=591445 RepID=A0AC34FEI6_9BILA
MEQIVLSVEYHGRRLNVWKEDNHGRYFVTPLCTMDPKSVKCDIDQFSPTNDYTFTFNVQLWDTLAATTIQVALLQQKGIDVKLSDIHPLPMQNVKLSVNREDMTSILKLNNRWQSHQSQQNNIIMDIGVKNKEFCDNMTKLAQADPGAFLSKTKLYFEFTMSTVQEVSKVLNITGKTVGKSDFFTTLKNDYSNANGEVILNSEDMNKLARDIYRTVEISDRETAGYIKSDEQDQIINHLLSEIKGQEVHSTGLYTNEWDSVFWDDIYARPDIQTEYFNETITYDSSKNHFKYDEAKDNEFRKKIEDRYSKITKSSGKGSAGFSFLEIGGSGGKGGENVDEGEHIDDHETKDKYTVSNDSLQEVINKNDVNVKWTGKKFTMKDLKLQRINTKTMQSLGEIYFKRIISSNSVTTQKLPILPDPIRNDNNPDKPPVYYEMLEKKVDALSANLKAEMTQINQRLATLEGGHEATKSRLSTLIECSHAASACTNLPIAQ